LSMWRLRNQSAEPLVQLQEVYSELFFKIKTPTGNNCSV
jgi:hypothetical protein